MKYIIITCKYIVLNKLIFHLVVRPYLLAISSFSQSQSSLPFQRAYLFISLSHFHQSQKLT